MAWHLPKFPDREYESFEQLLERLFSSPDERIKNNFENSEDFRLRLLNKLPKYGNDSDETDK